MSVTTAAADDFHVDGVVGVSVPQRVDLCLSDAGQREWERCNGQRQGKGRSGLQIVLHEIGVISR